MGQYISHSQLLGQQLNPHLLNQLNSFIYNPIDQITFDWPFSNKINPTKLIMAMRCSAFSTQLEIDFGAEFKPSIIALENRFEFKPRVGTCVLCRKEREVPFAMTFEYDGLDIIASPYSDTFGETCNECYVKHNGWEIDKLRQERLLIGKEISDSRTISSKRTVLIEKVGK